MIKLLKTANVDCYKTNKNNEYWCSVVFHRNALLIFYVWLRLHCDSFKCTSVRKHRFYPGAESRSLTVNSVSQWTGSLISWGHIGSLAFEKELMISHSIPIRLDFSFSVTTAASEVSAEGGAVLTAQLRCQHSRPLSTHALYHVWASNEKSKSHPNKTQFLI